jgi:hypothetical protein
MMVIRVSHVLPTVLLRPSPLGQCQPKLLATMNTVVRGLYRIMGGTLETEVRLLAGRQGVGHVPLDLSVASVQCNDTQTLCY